MAKLYGRWGAYEPRTPEEKAKARRQEQKRREEATKRAEAAYRQALLKDAERYRWLREHHRFQNDSLREIWFDDFIVTNDEQRAEFDAAIDVAMTLTPNVQHEGCGAGRRSIPLNAPVGREGE